jgi:lipopolysaccharide biosynthesis glycosyltransferase/glycosyltransferase involved in cell wall biosynthesis
MVVMSSSVQDRIQVALAADENFAIPLAVTVGSLLKQCNTSKSVTLHILDGGITEQSKARLIQSWSAYHANVNWYPLDMKRLAGLPISAHVTHTAYARLLLPTLLPADLKRVIYLDSDLLVRRDVAELWDLPFQGAACLAVTDVAAPRIDAEHGLANYLACQPHLAASRPIRNFRELGLDPSAEYFNSGVLVIDLDAWRDRNVAGRALACLENHREHVLWWDQYALNVVLHGSWRPLDVRWNQGSHIYRYPSAAESSLDPESHTKLLSDPWIVHFTSPSKPWQHGCEHPFTYQFLQALDETEWRGWRPRKPPFRLHQWLNSQYSSFRKWRRARRRSRLEHRFASSHPANRSTIQKPPATSPTPRAVVSVIIPTYRGDRFIPVALADVAAQSWPDWEVIVVEDGSRGETESMVRRFAAEHPGHRVEYLRHPHNINQSAARNTAIAAARGEFVALLDVDDRWLPTHLTASLTALHREGAAVAYSTVTTFDDLTGAALGAWGPTPAELNDFPFSLLRRSFVTPSATVLRRSLMNAVGTFNEAFCPCEDVDYWMRCIAAGAGFVHVSGTHVAYRKNHTGAQTNGTCRLTETYARVMDRHTATLKGAPHDYRRDAAKVYFGAAWCHATTTRDQDSTADPARATRLLRRATQLHPTKIKYFLHCALLSGCDQLGSEKMRCQVLRWLKPRRFLRLGQLHAGT